MISSNLQRVEDDILNLREVPNVPTNKSHLKNSKSIHYFQNWTYMCTFWYEKVFL